MFFKLLSDGYTTSEIDDEYALTSKYIKSVTYTIHNDYQPSTIKTTEGLRYFGHEKIEKEHILIFSCTDLN